ncbi:uncharacterized protein IWZ02DRAFT_54855 [Phyllosticta citriasiana]|uniref:uncharacterized protein n=1 Tax=Phyllosticta citriasiana TaxID=595635 RepID=UPI0030FD7A5C
MRQPAPHPPSANVLLPGPALLHSATCFSTTTWMLDCRQTSRTAELWRLSEQIVTEGRTATHIIAILANRLAYASPTHCKTYAHLQNKSLNSSIHPSIHPPGGITHFASAKLPMSTTVATRTHRLGFLSCLRLINRITIKAVSRQDCPLYHDQPPPHVPYATIFH